MAKGIIGLPDHLRRPDIQTSEAVPPWLATMRSIVGTHWAPGDEPNPTIIDWLHFIGAAYPNMADYCNSIMRDDYFAWDGLAVAYCMARAGIPPVFGATDPSRFLWPAAWLGWGAPVTTPDAGDVLVFDFGGGDRHVTLFETDNGDGTWNCLGGDQSHQVKLTRLPKSSLMGIRRPSAVGATRQPPVQAPMPAPMPVPAPMPAPSNLELAEVLSRLNQLQNVIPAPPAPPPVVVPTQVLPQHDLRSVGLFFATTREPAGPFSEGWFTGERATDRQTRFGQAFVRIPEEHRFGQVELPLKLTLFSFNLYEATRDPRKHFVIRLVDVLESDAWCDRIRSFPANEALVFVHGFNTSFEQGLYRNAQIVWDLKYKGIPILFSWASRGNVSDYLYDRESAVIARGALVELLQLLKSRTNITRVHILAHSMGNLVVLDALANYQEDGAPLNLGELMMAAPDVDRDLYLGIAARTRKITTGMTLYASSEDKALALSKRLAGEIPRAGEVSVDGPLVLPAIDSIDVSSLGDEMLGLNHGTYAATRSIINDLGIIIAQGTRPPDQRLPELRCVPEGSQAPKYWRYVP